VIVIVDYGMGNLGSIRNMLQRQGIECAISSDLAEIGDADRLVIPGVGAFDSGMKRLEPLREVLDRQVLRERVPTLGMCLGAQLMTRRSAEGQREGLGWIQADTVHLRTNFEESAEGTRFPHMGWNFVYPAREHPLLVGVPEPLRYYFAHTYKLLCEDPSDVLARTRYGEVVFTSGFAHQNLIGVQFHPEKSHRYGMALLANFAAWTPDSIAA
jgi:glutamine amidotransferase